jgi:heavy metal efflux system protein
LNAAKQRLMIAVPVSLILIFLLLFFAFNSVKHGLLIYTAIPLSAIGGIFFLALRGMPFSISAGVGFIALFGVAVLNGIVLIAEFNRLQKEGMTDLKAVVVTGAKVRLRPVMMTAFVASLGFLPMAISNGAGAEVQRPLATVVIGGLMLATFLTLFVLPILYIIFEKTGNSKANTKSVAVIILLFLYGGFSTSAQEKITLQDGIDMALRNNLTVKNEKLKSEYQEKLIKSSLNIPQANFSAEAGQINSAYTDTRFGISQSISFPTVYTNQKKLLNEEMKSAVLTIALREIELKRAVTQFFYTIILFREKEKLLVKADSIYAEFLSKTNLRLAKGESNILENTTAELQRGNIQLQLKALQQEIELAKLQFQLLLNTETNYEPLATNSKIDFPISLDSAVVSQHPLLKVFQQQKLVATANTSLEKSRLLPNLSLGINSMSIRGTGADNITYNASTRFNSAQIGVGIPIFAGALKARINASKVSETIADNNFQQQFQQLRKDYQNAFLQYQTNLHAVNYFENSGLKNASLIVATANKQFINGDINYLDWVVLINQSIAIQSNHLDAIKMLNESIISINYLTSK